MATRKNFLKKKKYQVKTRRQLGIIKKPKLVSYGKLYANWCGHCKSMENDWKMVEKRMYPLKSVNIESEHKDKSIAAFNKKNKTNLAIQNGYPTIFKLKKKGGAVDYYSGGRTESEMLSWLQSEQPHHKPIQQNQQNKGGFLAGIF